MKVTLCGSARFEPWFHAWNLGLTLSGHVVYSLAAFPSIEGSKDWYTEKQKHRLDLIHHQKIKESDAILVLNVFGYIGESTLQEIEVAEICGKQIYMLESWGKNQGIGDMHKAAVVKACEKYTGKPWSASPIKAHLYPGWHELLPPAGSLRNDIIQIVKRPEIAECYGDYYKPDNL